MVVAKTVMVVASPVAANLAVASAVEASPVAVSAVEANPEFRCGRRPVVALAAVIVRSATLIGLPRRQVAVNASTASRQDTVNHVPVDVSKAEVTPLIFVGQFLVV